MSNNNDFNFQSTFKGNKDHLKVLLDAINKDDIRIWNNWRSEDRNVVPILDGINLSGLKLMGIDFTNTDLVGADLSHTNLSQAEFDGAFLKEANLESAKLFHASLYNSSFVRANLQNSLLSGAVFNNAKLTGANISGASIHAISRTDWDVKDVICTHIYTDVFSKTRYPKSRDFKEGEFENIYKFHPIIEVDFKKGYGVLNIVLADYAAKELNKQHPDFDFKIVEIVAYGASPVIKVEIRDRSNSKEAEKLFSYEMTLLYNKVNELQSSFNNMQKEIGEKMSNSNKNEININGNTGTINIDTLIGNNVVQNQQIYSISLEQIEEIEKELSASPYNEEEKIKGKSILSELKDGITEEAKNRLVEWAGNLGEEALKKLPTLLVLLGQYLS